MAQCFCKNWINLLHNKFRNKGNMQISFKRNRTEQENNFMKVYNEYGYIDENDDINSVTEKVSVDKHEQAAAEKAVDLLEETNENLNKVIIIREDIIEELNDKLRNLSDEIVE